MQQIIDTVNAGSAAVYPFLRGVIDFTVGQGQVVKDSSAAQVNEVKKVQEKFTAVNSGGRGGLNGFPFNRNLIRIAGVSGALAVGLGAYGSHVIELNDKIDEEQKRSFRSANLYHFIGTFGLVASSLAKHPTVSGTLMAVGTFVFCGACYTYAITGDPSYKKYAPFGGSTLIVAWLSLVL